MGYSRYEMKTFSIKFYFANFAGQEEYEKLRYLSYLGTDVFLLCFSIAYPISYMNIKCKVILSIKIINLFHCISLQWVRELKHMCSKIPFILLGLKKDLRTNEKTILKLKDNGQKPITREEGIELAREIQAFDYIECSALTRVVINQFYK